MVGSFSASPSSHLPPQLHGGLRHQHCAPEASIIGDIRQRQDAEVIANQDGVKLGKVDDLTDGRLELGR